MHRKLISGLLVVAVPAAAIALVATPASAKTKAPSFTGAATGTVKCTLPKLKISFSPPLTAAYTGTGLVTVKGSLLSCVTSASSNVTIKKGKITGSFKSSGGCNGLVGGTTSPVTLTIQWKAKTKAGGKATLTNSTVKVNGAAPAYQGQNVGFELPNPRSFGGTITGSFHGSVAHESFAYSTTNATTAAADCYPTSKTTKKGTKTKPAKGIKKLKVVSGTINLP